MIIRKIKEYEFNNYKDSNKFQILIGNYATYNNYYIADFNIENKKYMIGLQVVTGGIDPAIILANKKIIIAVGTELYIYSSDCLLKKKIYKDYVFYEILKIENNYLLYGECGLIFFTNDFEEIWEKDFDEIISMKGVSNNLIYITNFTGKKYLINLKSGDVIE